MTKLNLLLLPLLLTACYEPQEGCLDPDAANYDLAADDDCSDCCEFPSLSIRIATVWDSLTFDPASTYQDAVGNNFELLNFRYYLGDLQLLSGDEFLPEPEAAIELQLVEGQDTTDAVLNANLILGMASAGATTSEVGNLRIGTASLSALSGTLGLAERYRAVFTPSVPRGNALGTQPGLLNFNDGRGYARARLQYLLAGDTLSVTTFGSEDFILDFGQSVSPDRGFNLTLSLQADLAPVIGLLDLSADSAVIASELQRRLPDLLSVVAILQ